MGISFTFFFFHTCYQKYLESVAVLLIKVSNRPVVCKENTGSRQVI